ncbi:GTPase ObgE [Christensenellaceae bacterium OttesenSCG-928-L17]|nr:GTPase ObgE [Christensenellaceae bacterium OttesenSCG-928-L17]
MQFIDSANITIKSGDGGNGCAAFHREKYVSRGGPSGGDGGRGGDIVLEADARMTTLLDFKYKRHYNAPRGEDGKPELSSGKNGEALVIRVPVGTVVRDCETGAVIADMNEDKKRRILLRGGRGGKGNARFATPTRQSPRFAQGGQKTHPREVTLELKTIADVGLVGLPNVGKSTLLSVLTAARPKIANYHFTTLTPNLGVVQRYEKTFVIADIPGLIEGAAGGAGLGHDFLRHIERTRMLVHVVDVSGTEGNNALDDYRTINRELAAYSETLAALPQMVAANKIDIPGAEENFRELCDALEAEGVCVFAISAAAHKGLDALLDAMVNSLSSLPPVLTYSEEEFELKPMYEPGFAVEKEDDGAFVVSGGEVERILDSTDPNDETSMRRFQQLLQKSGIVDALKAAGAADGDTVVMGEWEFEFLS